LNESADEYFTGGNPSWQRFINDHYNNFYCTYFTTRLIRGNARVAHLPQEVLLARAQAGLALMDGVYSTRDLGKLETDIKAYLGEKISVTETYYNAAEAPQGDPRWPKLLARVSKDDTRDRLEDFVRNDDAFMRSIGMA